MVSSALAAPNLLAVAWLAVPVLAGVQDALPLASAAVSPHGEVRHGARQVRQRATSQQVALAPLPADDAPRDSDGLSGLSLLRREAQEVVTAASDAGLEFYRLVDSQRAFNGSANGTAAAAPATTAEPATTAAATPATTVTTTLTTSVTETSSVTTTKTETGTQTTTKTVTVTTTQKANITSGFLIIGCARAAAFSVDERVAEAIKTVVSLLNNVFLKDVNVSMKCMRECHGKDASPANDDAPAMLIAAPAAYTGPLAAPGHALFQLAASQGLPTTVTSEHRAPAAAQDAARGTDEEDVAAAVRSKRGVVAVEYGINGLLTEDFVLTASFDDLTTKIIDELAQRGSAEKNKYALVVLGKTGIKDEVAGIVSMTVGQNSASCRGLSALLLPLLLGLLLGRAV